MIRLTITALPRRFTVSQRSRSLIIGIKQRGMAIIMTKGK